MAAHRDRNPFDEEEDDVNPFSKPSQSSHTRLQALPPEPVSYNYDRNPAINVTLDKATNLQQKERELQAKEAELKKREEHRMKPCIALDQKFLLSSFAGVFLDLKNWPPFFPIIHHDIANEIPDYLHRMQYVAFSTFLGLGLCLFWNVIAVSTASIKGEGWVINFVAPSRHKDMAPCSHLLHHRCTRSLFAMVSSALSSLQIHICFCIYAAVAPPIVYGGLSFPGILSAIKVMSDHALVGIFYLVGFGLLCVETLLSIWVFQRVYRYFRGAGKAAEAKRSAARGAAMETVSL
ncbi:hypothetical protein V6N12_062947 [Hibiscus sabdariffa]|uniref:Secretory carrier-associated membrane protein n=1 Tax=Hibiscus sabdariffa TaxID=183260 RepID=A0ABR2FAC5_9ROSI